MRIIYICLAVLLAQGTFLKAQDVKKKIKLFDGKTFTGWEGDTLKSWRIENGALVGGGLAEMVPHNEFISTTAKYSNYKLKLKFKLLGTEGFVNGGVQFHSERISNPDFEMQGYQADIGDGFWASLYDESRRDKLLVTADPILVKRLLKRGEWNDYEIRSSGRRIQIFLNGKQTVDYTEADQSIRQSGRIAFQLHGGGKTEVLYKNIMLYPVK
ncbi:hypothetical protein ACVWYN_002071 [Pedobacter sp. UYP24]